MNQIKNNNRNNNRNNISISDTSPNQSEDQMQMPSTQSGNPRQRYPDQLENPMQRQMNQIKNNNRNNISTSDTSPNQSEYQMQIPSNQYGNPLQNQIHVYDTPDMSDTSDTFPDLPEDRSMINSKSNRNSYFPQQNKIKAKDTYPDPQQDMYSKMPQQSMSDTDTNSRLINNSLKVLSPLQKQAVAQLIKSMTN